VTSFSAEREPPQGKKPQQDEKERDRMARARSWNVVFMIDLEFRPCGRRCNEKRNGK